MALKQKLTATEYGSLPDPEKANYKLVGADYVPDVEGVENLPGLLVSHAAERAARQAAEDAYKPFKGMTAERLADLTALEQAQKLGKLTSKGEYDEALAQGLKPLQAENSTLKQQLKDQALDHGLDAVLLRAGVIDKRLGNAKLAAKPHVRVAENNTLEIIGANGQPAGVEVDKFFTGDWKTNNLYFFTGNGGAGSGATGAGNQGAGEVPTKTRAEFAALTPQQKADFSELVGQGKAQLVQG